MNTLVMIQARLSSTRLPSKVLEPIGDHTALYHVAARAAYADVGQVIVACPVSDYRDLAESGLPPKVLLCGTGTDEDDVLGRFMRVWDRYGGDHPAVVRLTADCPFVDPVGIKAVAYAVASGEAEYAATFDWRMREPRLDGLDAEAFAPASLKMADALCENPVHREHVTTWMQTVIGDEQKVIVDPLVDEDVPPYRWTLDTPDDLAWFQAVAEQVSTTPPNPTTETLLTLMEARPELVRLSEMEVAA